MLGIQIFYVKRRQAVIILFSKLFFVSCNFFFAFLNILFIFRIRHFAGPVVYKVNGLLEKNSDILQRNISSGLYQSKLPLVQSLFPEGKKNIFFLFEGIFNKKKMLKVTRNVHNVNQQVSHQHYVLNYKHYYHWQVTVKLIMFFA